MSKIGAYVIELQEQGLYTPPGEPEYPPDYQEHLDEQETNEPNWKQLNKDMESDTPPF